MAVPTSNRLKAVASFGVSILIGAYGVYWGHKTQGAVSVEILAAILLVQAPISLIRRLQGRPGLGAVLRRYQSGKADSKHER
jgi:hypothetical protein